MIRILVIILICLLVFGKTYRGDMVVGKCRENTLNNPYGNYMFDDPTLISCGDEKKAYDFNTFNLFENAIDKKIDVSNVALRHYYTTPFTTYPNDSYAFANYLMKHKYVSCKEDNYCSI